MSGNSRCERSQFAYNDGISLTDLANRFGSDKGMLMGIGGPPHRYTYLYDLLLAPYRTRSINFLEFGLIIHDPQGGATGGEVRSPALQMWLEYFTKAMFSPR
jgi:hypothetical protein